MDLNVDAYIPNSYIPNEYQKLDIYKRIAGIEDEEEMDEMKKRKPTPLENPIHKQITPVLIRRETTDS